MSILSSDDGVLFGSFGVMLQFSRMLKTFVTMFSNFVILASDAMVRVLSLMGLICCCCVVCLVLFVGAWIDCARLPVFG